MSKIVNRSIPGVAYTDAAICVAIWDMALEAQKRWVWIRRDSVYAVCPMTDGAALIYAGSECFGTHPDSSAASVLEALFWQ